MKRSRYRDPSVPERAGVQMKRFLSISIVAALACAAVCGRSYAWTPGSATDSMCVHFSGDSRDLLVELRRGSRISGTVPLTLCNLEPGLTYELTVRGRGFELRRGYLTLDINGEASVRGNRLGTFARNIVPGYGSITVGRKGAGWSDLIAVAGAGLVLLREQKEYTHIENRYTNLTGMLESADNVEDRKSIRVDLHTASRDLNVQNTHRKRCLVLLGYLYGFQLIDPWLIGNPPKTLVTAGGSVVEVSGSGSSTLKAAVLSLIRPGRGQFYQGKQSRGVFYSLATTAGVLIALDYLNQYDEAVNAYEINLEQYDAAETVDGKEYYSQRSSEYWADVDKTRRWRNISYGVLAGIWAAGVIDTFIPGRDDAPSSDLSFNVGPTHATVVYRF
jgi:hypothetical protein